MARSLLTRPFLRDLPADHLAWLSEYDRRHLDNWKKLLADDKKVEAALAEAGVRQLLQGYGVHVEPNEDLTGAEQRPDFRCQANKRVFEVEVTHISIKRASRVTGLAEDQTGFHVYTPLTDAIFSACRHKAEQCSNASCPTLLAVVTFHSYVSATCFEKPDVEMLLMGMPAITWPIHLPDCQKAGDAYQLTAFHSAAFLRPDSSQEIDFARRSISALLLCGFGVQYPNRHGAWMPEVIGALHPHPARQFDPAALPEVEFGWLPIDRTSRQLHVSWPHGTEE